MKIQQTSLEYEEHSPEVPRPFKYFYLEHEIGNDLYESKHKAVKSVVPIKFVKVERVRVERLSEKQLKHTICCGSYTTRMA
jgi:hypothetical protein